MQHGANLPRRPPKTSKFLCRVRHSGRGARNAPSNPFIIRHQVESPFSGIF
jgi:hypothetical protein